MLVLAAAILPAPAAAAELAWRAPDDCARADAVRAQVGKLVGRDFEAIEGFDFEIAISVQADGRHVLVLRTVSERPDGAPAVTDRLLLAG